MKSILSTACLIPLLILALCGTLQAQEDITLLSDPSFTNGRRPPVPFKHDQHNDKAKITDCKVCHHVYKNGALDPSGDSAGVKCSECHSLKSDRKAMSLMRAYHSQCENCHKMKNAGPLTCGECHPQKAGTRELKPKKQ